MEQIRFGTSGLTVSKLCLGTMTFAREADERASFAIADYYADHGGFFLDTANIYGDGAAEATVGRWMHARGNRDSVVLATKVYGRMGEGPVDGSGGPAGNAAGTPLGKAADRPVSATAYPPGNNHGLSRLHIMREVEASLRRLKTDVIDLYQIHRWDFATPPEETIRALDDLIRQGKVRYIGASNLKGWMLSEFLHLADSAMASRFISLQQAYNAVNRSSDAEVLELCAHHGLAFMAYNPLAAGLLTGKYRRGQQMPAEARLTDLDYYNQRYVSPESLDLVEAFLAHAAASGMTPAQLALAWVLAEPRVHTPILGARNLEQITDTMGALEHPLSPEERAAVPAVQPGRWFGKDPVYDRTG